MYAQLNKIFYRTVDLDIISSLCDLAVYSCPDFLDLEIFSFNLNDQVSCWYYFSSLYPLQSYIPQSLRSIRPCWLMLCCHFISGHFSFGWHVQPLLYKFPYSTMIQSSLLSLFCLLFKIECPVTWYITVTLGVNVLCKLSF